MPVIFCHAPAAAIAPAGVDPGLAAMIAAGAVLLAAGLLLRLLAAAGRSRRRAPSAECVPSAGPGVVGAAAWEDTPERPGSGSTPSGTGALPVPERAGGEPAVPSGEGAVAALASMLDRSRRLRAAEERLARELSGLPAGDWIVERYALVGGRRVPFLLVGVGGVFVLSASDGAWTLSELDALARLGEELGELLPARCGPVHAGICLAFEETAPRSWHGGAELAGRGGWVLGIDWLRPWLYAHGADHGIGSEQLRRLDAAAGPRWNRRTRARLPGQHNVG